jgi:hypothetical protein
MYDIAQNIYFKYKRNEDKEAESQISLTTLLYSPLQNKIGGEEELKE